MKKREIRKTFCCVLLIILSLQYITQLFIPKDNTVSAGIHSRYSAAYGILAEPENSVDVIVVGDSESYHAIDPVQMCKEQGISAYVCGVAGQHAAETYFMLKKILKKQSPKVVVIETDICHTSAGKVKEMNRLIEKNLEYAFPLVKYHNRWKKLKKEDFLLKVHHKTQNQRRGFSPTKNIAPYTGGDYVIRTDEKKEMPLVSGYFVSKMIELLQEKNIKVLLAGMPSPVNWTYAKHNAIQELAAEKQIPYLDLNLHQTELGIDWQQDTFDKGDHLNSYGAAKVSRYLGSYLKEHYDLSDSRIVEQARKEMNHGGSYGRQTHSFG